MKEIQAKRQRTRPSVASAQLRGKLEKTITVNSEKLYTLSEKPQKSAILELKPKRAGLEVYAFTFGM